MSRLEVEIIRSSDDLSDFITPWRKLVETAAQPVASPEWLMAWWRHLAPPRASLAVVIVVDGRRLVAVAPYFAHRRALRRVEYRPLGAGFARPVTPVSLSGMETLVAPLIANAFANARPAPHVLTFEGLELGSGWPSALRASWPGVVRPLVYTGFREISPTLALDANGFEAWLAATSASFRQEMRKKRRRLARAGGSFQLETTDEDARRGIDAFVRLHQQRFSERGGSHFPAVGLRETLHDAAESLLADQRLRVFTVTVDHEIVGVQIAIAAGGRIAAWGVAFASSHARHSPGMLAMLAMIEDAHGRGEDRVDLGWGEADVYKFRFATVESEDDAIFFGGLMPWGSRSAAALPTVVTTKLEGHARRTLRRLPLKRQAEIKRLARGVIDRD